MDLDWAVIAPKLSSIAFHSSFAPLLAGGGLAYFGPWLIEETALKSRVDLARQNIIAKLASSHRRLLTGLKAELARALSIDPSDALSENSGNSDFADTDLVDQYAKEVFRSASLFQLIQRCAKRITFGYQQLLWSAALAIPMIVTAAMSDEARPFVTLIAFAMLLWQAIVVFRSRSVVKCLNEYEDSI